MKDYSCPYSLNELFKLLAMSLAFPSLDVNVHTRYNYYTEYLCFHVFPFL